MADGERDTDQFSDMVPTLNMLVQVRKSAAVMYGTNLLVESYEKLHSPSEILLRGGIDIPRSSDEKAIRPFGGLL